MKLHKTHCKRGQKDNLGLEIHVIFYYIYMIYFITLVDGKDYWLIFYLTWVSNVELVLSCVQKNVSKTLRMGIQNLGNSAIQILEGTGVAAEQALGTGARIVTGAAETAAEAAETGARSAIRIANVSLPF